MMGDHMKEMHARQHGERKAMHSKHESEFKAMMERHMHDVDGAGDPGETTAKDKPDYDREKKGPDGAGNPK